jgi:hypothetical protein
VAARETQAQVHPTVADLQAIFAARGGRFDLLDLIEMRALFGHESRPPRRLEARPASFDAEKSAAVQNPHLARRELRLGRFVGIPAASPRASILSSRCATNSKRPGRSRAWVGVHSRGRLCHTI